MKPQPIKPATLPPHLNRNTVANLPEESPRYICPDDVSMRETTGELFLYDDNQFSKSSKNPKKLIGSVGIMKAAIVDPETNDLMTGYVADLRHIKSADDFEDAAEEDAPDDQEEFSYWQEEREHEVPIAAVAFWGVDGKETVTQGDGRFANAAIHLATLSDKLEKKLAKEEAERRKKAKKAAAKAAKEAKAVAKSTAKSSKK